jgi:hypothetical protein
VKQRPHNDPRNHWTWTSKGTTGVPGRGGIQILVIKDDKDNVAYTRLFSSRYKLCPVAIGTEVAAKAHRNIRCLAGHSVNWVLNLLQSSKLELQPVDSLFIPSLRWNRFEREGLRITHAEGDLAMGWKVSYFWQGKKC